MAEEALARAQALVKAKDFTAALDVLGTVGLALTLLTCTWDVIQAL